MDEKEDCSFLPEKPKEPLQTDCCASGCSYCVFDVYQTELNKWEKECERILSGGKPSPTQLVALSQLEFKNFKLVGIYPSAKNLNIYRFAVPGGLRLDIKPGQHLMMKGFVIDDEGEMRIKENENMATGKVVKMSEKKTSHSEVQKQLIEATFLEKKNITRQYTVICNKSSYFEVLIKIYDNGEMSKYIKRLSIKDDVLWRGPFGEYQHHPLYSKSSGSEARTILALCAGTGIAPVYAIAKSIVSDEDDETRIRLLWANHSWMEVPLIQEIKELTSYWNFSCRLFLSEGLDDVPPGAKTFYEVNICKINSQILKNELDSLLKTNIQVLLCGTTLFEEDMMTFLNKLGLENSACHRFL